MHTKEFLWPTPADLLHRNLQTTISYHLCRNARFFDGLTKRLL